MVPLGILTQQLAIVEGTGSGQVVGALERRVESCHRRTTSFASQLSIFHLSWSAVTASEELTALSCLARVLSELGALMSCFAGFSLRVAANQALVSRAPALASQASNSQSETPWSSK